jgi:hypothetical protein
MKKNWSEFSSSPSSQLKRRKFNTEGDDMDIDDLIFGDKGTIPSER